MSLCELFVSDSRGVFRHQDVGGVAEEMDRVPAVETARLELSDLGVGGPCLTVLVPKERSVDLAAIRQTESKHRHGVPLMECALYRREHCPIHEGVDLEVGRPAQVELTVGEERQ